MSLLYDLGVGAYHLGIRLAARLGHDKARAWVEGRSADPSDALRAIHASGRSIVWVHVASLGEYEQARPVMARLREQHPGHAFVVTVFSPSGYARIRADEFGDYVGYLPPDTAAAADAWLAELRPVLAVFVKYEFWFHHLRALHRRRVATVLIAATFRAGQPFFRWYGGRWREMLRYYSAIIVQTEADARLIAPLVAGTVEVGGDPRLDRVIDLAEASFSDARLASFAAAGPVLLAGSVWADDVERFAPVLDRLLQHWRIILAPHRLREAELTDWQEKFGADRYTGAVGGSNVLLLDTIGILSRSYRYATIAYVGGGFGSGLHNTLEPLAYGLPTMFGPKYHKFPEAVSAVRSGGAFTVDTAEDLLEVTTQLSDPALRERASQRQQTYRELHRGAAGKTAALVGKWLLLLLLANPLVGQSWSEADRMVETLNDVFAKCNLMTALSGQQWRPGLCMAATRLRSGESASLELNLRAGETYSIIATGESPGADIDLYLRAESNRVIAFDDQIDGTPVLQARIDRGGSYTLQVHSPDSPAGETYVAIGLLRAGGGEITNSDFRRISRQFGAAAGAVRAAGGAARFGGGQDGWSVLGYLLAPGEDVTVANLQLPGRTNFIAATASPEVRDLDLYLADEQLNILRRDRDPDPSPMLEIAGGRVEPVYLYLDPSIRSGRGVVLLGFFER